MRTTMAKVHWTLWVAIIALVAGGAALSVGSIITMRRNIRDLSEKLDEANSKASKPLVTTPQKPRDEAAEFKRRADQVLAEAQNLRDEAVELERKAEEMSFRENEKMHELYRNLIKLDDDNNKINDISSFKLAGPYKVNGPPGIRTGAHAIISHNNKSTDRVKPNFRVHFLDKNGFVIDTLSVLWVSSSVDPGETRVEDMSVDFSMAIPVYYISQIK
jgi:hypothetical protein